ncbi:hypothetical protein [Candidatus Phyllobacterium onerii]|uniref:hypothetical protein n=1 Tax=Candidatus Phyllobacterium onerii TaxID=3020828 RepID=UPI00232ACBC6|nr:hypothetical protein [Phyllobacterium sp. IY22]
MLLHVVLPVCGAMVGLAFRPFWLSEWGPITFVLLLWIASTVVAGWGHGGAPFSFRFGLICGSGLALSSMLILYHHKYVGMGAMAALIYLGVKTKFFERRFEKLGDGNSD